ncbi:pyrroline-5-carboxylate reductase [Hyphococcus luteus]|uniref:Pyrroline-5-carboxylate reductase n=1 Tax=Hyphococcus luteus TaxID=2058213 RepID=A0A2S7K0X6_9PROT|nr:pyrroline-5-carboxylate reductase [Marinicaulis flavus]PQA86162.1 pyrroline-5-carboxylate reductase [Marinicaulis flavus]
MTDKPSVALIGAGAMGGALLKGWLAAGTIDPGRSAALDPNINDEMKALCEQHGIAVNGNDGPFDAMLLAVKPQVANDVLPSYAGLAKDAVAISVMAGKSIETISGALGGAKRVVRAMPNLPAAIGKGVSGLYAPEAVEEKGRAVADALMRAAGEVVWVRSEQEIDFVTAISGSGPAYYFLLTEALGEAGVKLGLDKDAAAALARATLVGAGALVASETRSAAELRKAVTSPGGTTEAALNVFDGDGAAMRRLVEAAVAAAAKRAGELTQ